MTLEKVNQAEDTEDALRDDPLVSVIIPCYNSRQWVGQAIDSVLNQTYPNIEIIVVDDGSTDGVAGYIKTNYYSTGQVRYFYQSNGGVSRARNYGLKQARGAFISFLDADDWLLPEKVARQVSFLQKHPDYQVAYCDYWCSYDNEGSLELPAGGRLIKGVSGQILPELLAGTVVIMHAAMLRRECLEITGGFKEDLVYAEDWEFWLRLAGMGFRYWFMPQREVVYRLRRSSRSTNNYQVQLCRNRICRYISEAVDPVVLKEALRSSGIESTFQFGLARAYFEQKKYKAGLRQTLAALKTGRSRKAMYVVFCLGYVLALPLLGYNRLEKLVMRLVELFKIKI
ncbi:MAG: hypothetical protein JWP00_604 [Chloroflexi bacterium]|nr:hypothetical protein [Chloroflexota bacterium]